MREIKMEIEILELLYQNILMIKESITNVIKTQKIDEILNNDLKECLFIYRRLIQAITGMLKTRKKEVKNLSVGEKMATYMSIKINLGKSNDTSDIAKLIIQDISFISTQIKESISEYAKISKTIINLSNRIILANDNCIQTLKKYVN